MSLLSALAFLASAISAKRPKIERDPIDVEIIVHLQTELDDLRRQFDETLTRVERQRDDWQALAMEYRDALFRRPAPQRHFIDEETRLRMEAQARTQTLHAAYSMMQANAQVNAQAHQLSMQNGPYIGQRLGQHLDEYIRNCTPGRHELLTRDGH